MHVLLSHLHNQYVIDFMLLADSSTGPVHIPSFSRLASPQIWPDKGGQSPLIESLAVALRGAR
jgi:hypothetical protein